MGNRNNTMIAKVIKLDDISSFQSSFMNESISSRARGLD
jgi:hypothetical protein